MLIVFSEKIIYIDNILLKKNIEYHQEMFVNFLDFLIVCVVVCSKNV